MKGEQNMVNTGLYIPDKIKVGYQKREGTYTGKLAYVIYYDEKGKLRKEASWNSWRKHDIEPQEFDNVPTEGFVLNKKVGDYSNGWDHRQAYVRVYDPRDFEFEITVENLLYILEHCSSIKGKGLEGEFVYSWDGKDLVLLPVGTIDYKESKARTEIIQEGKFLKPSEIKVGKTYVTKQGDVWTYLGKYDYYDTYWYGGDIEPKVTKKHFFAYRFGNNHISWQCRSTINKFFRKEEEEDTSLYLQGLKQIEKEERVQGIDLSHFDKVHLSIEEVKNLIDRPIYNSHKCLVDIGDSHYSLDLMPSEYKDKYKIRAEYWDDYRGMYSNSYHYSFSSSSLESKFSNLEEIVGEPVKESLYTTSNYYLATLDKIMKLKPYGVQVYLKNGVKHEVIKDRRYRGVILW